jgi:hypothetical protein
MDDGNVDGYTAEELLAAAATNPKGCTKSNASSSKDSVCPHCGKKGHKTSRSSKCTRYVPKVEGSKPICDLNDVHKADRQAAEDLENFDAQPLGHDNSNPDDYPDAGHRDHSDDDDKLMSPLLTGGI